jgi:hypothetical protein
MGIPHRPAITTLAMLTTLGACAGSSSFETRQAQRDSAYDRVFSLLSDALAPHIYDFALIEVEHPGSAADRYSEPVAVEQDTAGLNRYIYSDSLIAIGWVVDNQNFHFVLENRTDHSIRLIWNEAAFVDSDRTASRVMHEGVRYAARNESQPPSVVPRGGRITDRIVPTDRVVESSGGWGSRPIVQPVNAGMGSAHEAQKNIGKKFSILLPLEIQGVVNEFVFTFEIVGVEPAAALDRTKHGLDSDTASTTP